MEDGVNRPERLKCLAEEPFHVQSIGDVGADCHGSAASGTGLSIVRALVRDEMRGTLELSSGSGARAEVVFPA